MTRLRQLPFVSSVAVAVILSAAAARAQAPQQGVVKQYCVNCHSDRNKANAGGLSLEGVRLDAPDAHADTMERMVRKLRAGLMPPPGLPRPEAKTYRGLLTSLESSLDAAAARKPNPGRKDTFHRLNRTEYKNVIRDLLHIDVDVENMLPIDNPSYGFDNIAGTLTLNESLMEQYLSAAQLIGNAALGVDSTPVFKEFRAHYEMSQEDRMEGFPMGTRGGLRAPHTFPQDGEYTIEVKLMCGSIFAGEAGCSGASFFPDAHEMEVTVDGERAQVIVLKARGAAGGNAQEAYRLRVPVKAGPHVVAAWFIKQPSVDEFDGTRVKFDKPMHRSNAVSNDWQAIYQPYIASITLGGPYSAMGPGETPSRRRLLTCVPGRGVSEAACARRVLSTLARRAYRRAVTPAEVDNLMSFFEKGRVRGFEAGIELALRRVLTSPAFLFRIESDPGGSAPDTNYRISDVELASRLSFFLWRSMPDDVLLDVAIQGRLNQPVVLEQQIRRMLVDGRAQTMIEDFAGQWLQLRKVDVAMPNAQMFPNFDITLRNAMRRETELFVDSIRKDDRSVLDLLTADYTFLNERLAKHYAIPGVKGSHFRRVVYPAGQGRGGLLGHGSILMVTSSPIRTRPVVRGKFILETLLGTPPPAPPADVPPLRETGSVLAQTMRERMAAHRANAVCASCHSMIDPLGFALEQFNPVGQLRKVDENFVKIDASGVMPDGTKFDGVDSFRGALVKSPDLFVNTMAEKLMIYALGRGLEPYDYPAVRKIVRDAGVSNYRLSSVVLGLVKSVPFQMRRTLPKES